MTMESVPSLEVINIGSLAVFECPLCCCTEFLSKEELHKHLTEVSQRMTSLDCKLCQQTFPDLQQYIEHLRTTCKSAQENPEQPLPNVQSAIVMKQEEEGFIQYLIVDNNIIDDLEVPMEMSDMEQIAPPREPTISMNPSPSVFDKCSSSLLQTSSKPEVSLKSKKELVLLKPKKGLKASLLRSKKEPGGSSLKSKKDSEMPSLKSKKENEVLPARRSKRKQTFNIQGPDEELVELLPPKKIVEEPKKTVEVRKKKKKPIKRKSVKYNPPVNKSPITPVNSVNHGLPTMKSDPPATVSNPPVSKYDILDDDYDDFDKWFNEPEEKKPKRRQSKLPSSFCCEYCGKICKRNDDYIKHVRVHTGEKPCICVVCGKGFRVTSGLTLHMRTHTNERPYKCGGCQRTFKSYSHLDFHKKSQHSDLRNYQCSYCGKTFKTIGILTNHRKTHYKPFECELCKRVFTSGAMRKKHYRLVHSEQGKEFKCVLCGEAYGKAWILETHLKSHPEFKAEDDESAETIRQMVEIASASIGNMPYYSGFGGQKRVKKTKDITDT